jgi:hypothetical protein
MCVYVTAGRSCDSSVGIATGYELDGRGFGDRFSVGKEKVKLSLCNRL